MREIPLTKGMVALVDDWNYEALARLKWYASRQGATYYAQRQVFLSGARWTERMQSVVMGLPPEPGMVIAHINGDGLDNRRENLLWATRSERQRVRRDRQIVVEPVTQKSDFVTRFWDNVADSDDFADCWPWKGLYGTNGPRTAKIADLRERDGDRCFYCDETFPAYHTRAVA